MADEFAKWWSRTPQLRWPSYLGWKADAFGAPTIRGPSCSDLECREWPGCRVIVGFGSTISYAWLLRCVSNHSTGSIWEASFAADPPEVRRGC